MSGGETTATKTEEDRGMASCYCREAVNSLVEKLTRLMETRPVVRDPLQGLAADELLQMWKMILEMAYGIDDWTDPKLAASRNLAEWETERERIRELQALIRDARGRCRSYGDGRLLNEAPPTSEADQDGGGQKKKAAAAVGGDDDPEEPVDANAAIESPAVSATSDDLNRLSNVSIRFGSMLLPISVKQCVMNR